MRWAGNVAPMREKREKRNAYNIFMGKPEGKRLQGRPRRRWTILQWILERQDEMVWIGLMWLRIGTSGGTL
jgi:hypothetical protein